MSIHKYAFPVFLAFIIIGSACLDNRKSENTPSELTDAQNKLVENMRKRVKEGMTVTATRDVLTITELNNQNKADTTYYLLNLKNNEDFEYPLKEAGFKQLKFIRMFEGRKQVNNYQIGNYPMTDEPVEYIE